MSIKADTNPRFFWRFALIGVVLLGWTGLCFKDALYSYPRKRDAALAKYRDLRESDKLDEWQKIAAQNDWKEVHPDESDGEHKLGTEYEADIVEQYLMAAVCTPLGLWALIIYLRSRGRWMEADQDGIRSSWGPQLDFEQIETLDKKKWKEKGIVKIKYDAAGRRRRFVLDDCKFDRGATEAILRLVEANVQEGQIINGFPEPLAKAEQEPADAAEAGDS